MQRITSDSEISYVVTEKELKEIRANERIKTIDEIMHTKYFADKVEIMNFEAYIKIDDLLDFLEKKKGGAE